MSKDLIFYTNPQSRGRIVRWMLEEVGADYQTEVMEYASSMKSPDYLAINPMGKVPAINHKGKVVTECSAICAYLADAFPAANMAPALSDRQEYYRWMFFTAGPFEAALTDKVLGVDVPKEKQSTVGYGNFDAAITTLAKAVENRRFIAGDQFTAADVYVGSQISYGLMFNSIPDLPAFVKYWEGLRDREAYKTATAKDDALVPAAK